VGQRQSENTFLWMDVIWLVPWGCFHAVNFKVVLNFKLISDSGQISFNLLFFSTFKWHQINAKHVKNRYYGLSGQ